MPKTAEDIIRGLEISMRNVKGGTLFDKHSGISPKVNQVVVWFNKG